MGGQKESKQLSEKEIQNYQNMLLRKRINDREIQKVKTMGLHELLQKSRPKQSPLPPSPTPRHEKRIAENHLRNAGFSNEVEQVAEKHLEMIRQAEQKNRIMRRQMREAPIFSQIKRGKLGFDSILILFAMFGSIALPYIFFQKFKKHKEIIIESRKYPPEVIQNISDDSPIDIDEVSEQSIMYDNPGRRAKFQKSMETARKISKLKRQLDL